MNVNLGIKKFKKSKIQIASNHQSVNDQHNTICKYTSHASNIKYVSTDINLIESCIIYNRVPT